MRLYDSHRLWKILTFNEKLKCIAAQFGPRNWKQYDWQFTITLKRWLFTCSLVAFFLISELSPFYLKFVFWIPTSNFLYLGRLWFIFLVGYVTIRELMDFLDNELVNHIFLSK